MKTKIVRGIAVVGGATVAASGALVSDAKAQGFEGYYGGLSYGSNFGEPYQYTDEYTFEGSSFGAFGGVNIPLNDDWMIGAELAVNGGAEMADGGYNPISVSNMMDARIRLGRTFGDTMVYGAMGVSTGGATSEYDDGIRLSGTNMGFGVEWNMYENMFLGGDYTTRNIEGGGIQGTLNNATVRFGMRF
jgi:hypothetical protein